MRLSVFKLVLLLPFTFTAFAQNTEVKSDVKEQVEEITYPYYVEVIDERDKVPFNIKVVDPKLIEARLDSLQNIMPLVYNSDVAFWLHFFSQRRPNFTKTMMERKNLYFPTFEKTLEEYEMPDELKYLAILESGLNPKAVSRSKAVGLWQFMSFTGKEYGLTVDANVDERMHPEKSTDAAARYLKYLNSRFGNWDLALASYNTGPGRISRAMRRSGSGNYWDLHKYIHKDTRAYVPQFIALVYILNYGEDHGIFPDEVLEKPDLETIFIKGEIDLEILANLTNSSITEVLENNPHIKTTILPQNDFGYDISIPVHDTQYFYENRVAILDSASSKFKSLVIEPEAPVLLAEASQQDDGDYTTIVRQVKQTHRVKRGEILNRIATRYNVSVTQIKRWNNKSSNKILVGEQLTIYVNKTEKVKSNSILAQKSSDNVESTYYTVQKGDTLWNISQRYEGVTVNDLKKWNNLTDNKVRIGQKIKINS